MSDPTDIDRTETTAGAEEFALELLIDAADTARALVGNLSDANAQALSRPPIVAIGYALLVHLDHRADEQYQQGRALIEALEGIRERVKFLAPRSDSNDPSHKLPPASERALSDYAWLKELLDLARPTFSDPDYREALIRLRRLAGV
jgi:hypothetical protein